MCLLWFWVWVGFVFVAFVCYVVLIVGVSLCELGGLLGFAVCCWRFLFTVGFGCFVVLFEWV